MASDYASVSVNVSSDEQTDLEKARQDAIENGEMEAFHLAVSRQGYENIELSNELIKQYIDGYTIHDEQIGRNFYKARVEYRINMSSIANAFKKLRDKRNSKNTLIVVASLKNWPDEFDASLYSISKYIMKYRYSKRLDTFFKKANVKVHYESIN